MVRGGLRLIGVGGQNEDLDASQENDAFELMMEMLASWGSQPSMLPVVTQESFSLVAGTSSYTIGSGQTWDTDRPNNILGGFIRSGAGDDYPLRPLSRQRWADIVSKSQGYRPERFYYRPDVPYGTVVFDSAPSAAETVYLDLEKPLSSIATLDTTITLPPEYYRAIRYNLAVHLAPEYERQVSREVAVIADESLMAIRRRNVASDIVVMDIDPILSPRPRYRSFETT